MPVNDQAKALKFYTEVLGFEKKEDIAMGEHRWLTVVSPEGVHGVELLLEPLGFAPAVEYYKALFDAKIPCTQFATDDIHREVKDLRERGAIIDDEPQTMGNAMFVSFEDTCGNYICLVQQLDNE